MQLAYYLELQDRIDEAVDVYSHIDRRHFELNTMAYDYMYAYFTFLKAKSYNDGEKFTQMRGVLQKYENCGITHWKILF